MTIVTQSADTIEVISRHGIADVWYNTISRHHSLHAVHSFSPGDCITSFRAKTTHRIATWLTVQKGCDEHITLEPDFLQFINHSCDPNVFFDTTLMQLICIRPVKIADELCFFYPSSEWEMAQPFDCNCQHINCLKTIKGAASLNTSILGKYRLTDFIAQKISLHQ